MTRLLTAARASAAALTLALASSAAAQDWQMPPADDPMPRDDAPGTEFEQGLESMMDEMFQRLQPHMEGIGNELARTMNEFSPALNELAGVMDDLQHYERPERLPNGDIIIRRRADAPPPPPLDELQRLLPEPDPDAPETPGWPEPEEDNEPVPQIEL